MQLTAPIAALALIYRHFIILIIFAKYFTKEFFNPINMKYVVLFFIFQIISNQVISKKDINFPFQKECIKSYLGNIEICLPEINGMTECYKKTNIKPRVDEFKVQGNTIHAYYLNDSIFNIIDGLQNLVMTDVFKVYSINETHSMPISFEELNQIFDLMTKEYMKNIIDTASIDFSLKFKNINFSNPVVIKIYKPSKNIKTALTLIKSYYAGKESVNIMSYSLVAVKKRLLFYSYYLKYNDIESINTAKERNDYYGLKLNELNK